MKNIINMGERLQTFSVESLTHDVVLVRFDLILNFIFNLFTFLNFLMPTNKKDLNVF